MNQTTKDNIIAYSEKLKVSVLEKLSNELNAKPINDIIKDLQYHINNSKSNIFQRFYFETLSDEKSYNDTNKNFFKNFKRKYGLQGIDNNFLDELERNKIEILRLIKLDLLTDVYFNIFYKAKIKHKEKIKEKNLGSFFTKLVHTFRPDEYCALDNPVRGYFHLENESFFISFFIISNAYRIWAENNNSVIIDIRRNFIAIDKNNIVPHSRITDMKLLDLIFWAKADRLKKDKKRSKK